MNKVVMIGGVVALAVLMSPFAFVVMVSATVATSAAGGSCVVASAPAATGPAPAPPPATANPAPAPTPGPAPAPGATAPAGTPTPSSSGPWRADGKWSSEQVANAAIIVEVGLQQQVPQQGWIIAIATAMQESSLRNLGHQGEDNDNDSLGLFQQRPSKGWGTPEQLLDPRYASARFYGALLAVDGWQAMPLTKAAQAVQHSAYPDAYAKWQDDAEHLVDMIKTTLGIVCTSDGGDGLPGGGDGIPPGYTLPSNAQQAAAVSFALAQLGKPYKFGAEGPDSYDCSGLMMAAWAAAGVKIPRVTGDQVRTGIAVASLAEMQPGDLILIPGSDGTMSRPGHVGMYIGTGGDGKQYLVQAPHTGDVVKVTPVSNWARQVAAIRRPLTK